MDECLQFAHSLTDQRARATRRLWEITDNETNALWRVIACEIEPIKSEEKTRGPWTVEQSVPRISDQVWGTVVSMDSRHEVTVEIGHYAQNNEEASNNQNGDWNRNSIAPFPSFLGHSNIPWSENNPATISFHCPKIDIAIWRGENIVTRLLSQCKDNLTQVVAT